MDERKPETSTGVLAPYSRPYSSPYSLPCFRESTGWSRGESRGGGESPRSALFTAYDTVLDTLIDMIDPGPMGHMRSLLLITAALAFTSSCTTNILHQNRAMPPVVVGPEQRYYVGGTLLSAKQVGAILGNRRKRATVVIARCVEVTSARPVVEALRTKGVETIDTVVSDAFIDELLLVPSSTSPSAYSSRREGSSSPDELVSGLEQALLTTNLSAIRHLHYSWSGRDNEQWKLLLQNGIGRFTRIALEPLPQGWETMRLFIGGFVEHSRPEPQGLIVVTFAEDPLTGRLPTPETLRLMYGRDTDVKYYLSSTVREVVPADLATGDEATTH